MTFDGISSPGRRARLAGALLAGLVLAGLAPAQPGRAEEGRPGITLVQASPDAKESAERFLAYLKKQGYEVSHGDIEAADTRGFRIKDLAMTGPHKNHWKAASFEAASFDEQPSGEAALNAATVTGFEITGPDKAAGRFARATVDVITWSAKKKVSLRGLSLRDGAVTQPSGQVVKIATVSASAASYDGVGSGTLEKFAVRGVTVTGGTEGGSVGSIDIESVAVDMPTRVAIKGLAVRDVVADTKDQGMVRVGAIELRDFESLDLGDRNPADLRALHFVVTGLEAPITGKDPAFAKRMSDLGYHTIKLNAELAYHYALADKSFNLDKLEIDVADVAALALHIKIAGLSPDDIKQMMQPPPPAPNRQQQQQGQHQDRSSHQAAGAVAILARLNLISADLVYRDRSILNRVLKLEAAEKKTDPAAIRAQYRAMLTAMRDQQKDPAAKEVFDAVIAFLDNPGELVVEVRPPSPLSLIAIGSMAMASPEQLRSMLGLKVTAKKP